MEVIDEEGRVFGVVNVIDLLVVLFLLAVVAAGAALVIGGDGDGDGTASGPETETVTVTVQSDGVEPYVAEAVPDTGAVDSGNVTAVERKSVEPATVFTTNDSGAVLAREHPRLKRVELEVTVEATRTDGQLRFDGQRLVVGQRVGLDFETVVFRGEVTAISE